MNHFYGLIMAGGGGTRLWPLSRQAHPKQMLKLFGERTMFQLTVDRLAPLLPLDHVFVIASADQIAPLAEQIPDLPRENFIVEPLGRGTAPCIGLSALHLRHHDPDAVMAVLAADHIIRRKQTFHDVLSAAHHAAEQGYLVTLGIAPTYPSTGYGYVGRGAPLGEAEGFEIFRVERFTEKPDAETATRFVAEGRYAWNSGMFIWQVDRILEEIQKWMPALHETLETLGQALGSPAYEEKLQTLWPALRKETIDYGIMEKADKVAVIPADLGWSDVGSWASVMAQYDADAEGNVVVGDALTLDVKRTLVFSAGKRLVATVGVEDLVVVDTPNALLIVPRSQVQRVREVVNALRSQERDDVL
jgi:mannose-1-phosphate guanylyltransferase